MECHNHRPQTNPRQPLPRHLRQTKELIILTSKSEYEYGMPQS